MSYTPTSGMENLQRIENLVAANLSNILKKENENDSHINLYNLGDFWVAFENSAFQLEQLSDNLDGTLVMRLKNRPFPLILNTISDTKVRSLCRSNTHKDFLQIPATPLDKESFRIWYRDFITP